MPKPQVLNKAPYSFKGTEIYTLSNGLRVILNQDKSIPVTAMQVWARCGAIDEEPRVYGISHGLEHMVFKGTPTRSAGEITRLIESNGGAINAATQLETTHYYIDIPSYGTKPALEVLLDTILNPTFPKEELDRERLVILEEINRRDDSPDATLWDEFASHVFKGTPYGIKVIGSRDSVSAITTNDLHQYFRQHYVPSNLSVVLSGDFNKSMVLDLIQTKFEKLKPQEAPKKPTVQLDGNKLSDLSIKKHIQLSYVAMGFSTIGMTHKDSIALDLIADILGGGASARLYQKLREEEEMVFSISSDYIPFQQKGMFAVFLECLPQNVDRAINQVKEEINRFGLTPPTSSEMIRAKTRIKSDWLHGSETPHGRANSLGSLSIHGQIDLLSRYLPEIESLSIEHLKTIFSTYLANASFATVTLNPES
ncbi:MAG: M16 family metallopeptidase [Elusimicrobiota bacterium]